MEPAGTTTGEWVKHAEARLAAAGVESARLEAQVLAAHVLRVDRSWLLAHPEHEFPDLAGETLLQRREAGEPLAYLLGYREFFGRRFSVGPGVLVPRQDTEILVESALAAIDRVGAQTVLDVGTGSGVLPITLALERPGVSATGLDISPRALEFARRNGEDLGTRVRWLLSDALAAVAGETFDVIVSNPPYIADDEPLPVDVANHEPPEALFSGPTGLEFYERLAREAGAILAVGGAMLMEVGHTQAAAVRQLFEAHGWRHIATHPDLAGIARVVEVAR